MPLATILTSASSGRGSVSSSLSIVKAPNFSRTTAAVISMTTISGCAVKKGECPTRAIATHHSLVCERSLQLAVLVLGRIEDDLLVTGHVLIEPAALNVLELHEQHACRRPFAEFVESDFADDRVERVVVDVACELVVVEAAGRLDCLLQDLHRGIGEGRLVEAERVGAGLLGPRLVLLQELLDAGEIHFGARDIEMVVHDAVELFAQLLHE